MTARSKWSASGILKTKARAARSLSLEPNRDDRDVVNRRGIAAECMNGGDYGVNDLLRALSTKRSDDSHQPLVGKFLVGLVARLGDPVAEGDDDVATAERDRALFERC